MEKNISAINRERVTELALKELKGYIIANGLCTGDRLPSEIQLSQDLGISRSSIREALMSLEAIGIISTRQGKGRYIQDYDYPQLIDSLSYNVRVNFKDFLEVVHVRRALEEYFLPKAALLYTDEDIQDLEKSLEDLRMACINNVDEKKLVEVHALFHKRLYKSIGNKLLDSLITLFSSFQKFLSDVNKPSRTPADEFYQRHRALLDAVVTQNKDKILCCFSSHFSDFHEDSCSFVKK